MWQVVAVDSQDLSLRWDDAVHREPTIILANPRLSQFDVKQVIKWLQWQTFITWIYYWCRGKPPAPVWTGVLWHPGSIFSLSAASETCLTWHSIQLYSYLPQVNRLEIVFCRARQDWSRCRVSESKTGRFHPRKPIFFIIGQMCAILRFRRSRLEFQSPWAKISISKWSEQWKGVKTALNAPNP